MRRPVLQATLAGPIALIVALGLLASGAAHASETVSSAPGSRYTLRIEGVPDSVAAAVCGSDGATDRLWSREELDRVASSLRDALLSLVRYDATVRLTRIEGVGTAPGIAVVAAVAREAEGGGVPSPGATAARAVPHVRTTDPRGPAAAEAAFARGVRASASAGAIAAGIGAVRDQAVAEGRYASTVSVDSVVPRGDEVHVHLLSLIHI